MTFWNIRNRNTFVKCALASMNRIVWNQIWLTDVKKAMNNFLNWIIWHNISLSCKLGRPWLPTKNNCILKLFMITISIKSTIWHFRLFTQWRWFNLCSFIWKDSNWFLSLLHPCGASGSSIVLKITDSCSKLKWGLISTSWTMWCLIQFFWL